MARLTDKQRINLTILVAALGYFVDVFDLQLFSMLRVSSLKSLGLDPAQITIVGAQLLNWQMAGMLLGGILWGVLGDKKGRVYVLFGTILLYSLGNIANAFVTTIPAYAAARFFTGLGLAGEIGAGVTLATELLPKATRGYGTSMIVGCGVVGPLVAGFMADALDWRMAYIGGGVLGLMLLLLRVSVSESGMFGSVSKQSHVARGKFIMLFNDRERLARYACCVASGLPVWFMVGVIVIFSPEIGVALGTDIPLKPATAVVSCYIGLTLGGFLSGILSQIFQNRRKVMMAFILGAGVTCKIILMSHGISAAGFYGLVLLGGFFIGYWTLFMTTTAEQFGTNLRATATATASNFVRASIIVNTMIIAALKPHYGFLQSAEIDGAFIFLLTAIALWKLPETFNRDLDFTDR
jgi:MFS family permease